MEDDGITGISCSFLKHSRSELLSYGKLMRDYTLYDCNNRGYHEEKKTAANEMVVGLRGLFLGKNLETSSWSSSIQSEL